LRALAKLSLLLFFWIASPFARKDEEGSVGKEEEKGEFFRLRIFCHPTHHFFCHPREGGDLFILEILDPRLRGDDKMRSENAKMRSVDDKRRNKDEINPMLKK
jgi:hypothetical protein